MNNVLTAFVAIIKHIVLNVSNYSFIIGLAFILYYVAHTYGIPTLILSVGVLLVAFGFLIEISKNSKKNSKNLKKF